MIDKHKNARVCFTGALLLAMSGTLPARADYQSTVLSQGPVGYYRLNETTQPQANVVAANLGSLGPSAAGTYNNFPSRGLPGPFAGSVAIGLDGGSQYVSTPWQGGLSSSSFSFEMWVNPKTVPNFGYVASSGQMASPRTGWYLAQDNGSTFGYGSAYVFRTFINVAADPGVTVYAPVNPAGTWLHLVLTYDAGTSTASIYTNGVLAMSAVGPHVANASGPTTVGCRSSLNFFWPGQAAEVAMYNTALSASQVTTHYTTATSSPANYATTVLANAPVLYHRYQEAADPAAVNASSVGSSLNGLYIYDAKAGVPGPITPTYPGFDAGNKATAFANGGGVVRIPPLNLNTNTVTISCWINATNAQSLGTGIVLHGSGANACGLTFDQIDGGLGLGYIWNNNNYGWAPSRDSGYTFPTLPNSQWAFAALVIEPAQATLYICDANNFANFASIANSFGVTHAAQAFASPTLVGAAAGYTAPDRTLNGAVDEVAIFKRALSAGELYTQYASAVGGVPVRIFTDLQGPTEPVAVGDPLVLKIDAGGTPDLTYTWHKDSVTVGTTTNGVFTIASAALGDAGTYDVTIANSQGSAQSQQVYVGTVTPATPEIVALPGYLSRTLYPTGTLSMAVVATGGGLKYQWYKNTSPISGATGSAYTLALITNSSVAGNYSVSVTNSVGSATSGPPAIITIASVTAGSYEASMVSSGPEAWWRLNESAGSTNLVDSMGRHNGYYTNVNGTVPPVALGAAGALVGNPDTAAAFSANGGVGVVPYSPMFGASKFTIEGWAKTTVLNDTTLTCWSSTYGASGESWRTSPAGEWRPWSSTTSAPLMDNGQTNASVVYNGWTHLVICYDQTLSPDFPWSYYINGFRAGGYSWSGPAPNSGGPLIIGGRGVSATTLADLFWNGSVDEVAFYQRVLPAPEIQAHYAARGVEILPPSFSGPLLSQTVATGKTITFSTTVQGTAPISLQWYKGAAPLLNATNNSLTIGPTTLADIGSYTLWATNSAGTVSTSATLDVFTPTGYANVTNDLVLHLRFDGNANDSSGRGNNGTESTPTAPAYVAGIIGSQALQYITETTNGSSTTVTNASYVVLGAPADLLFGSTTSFSIGTWVKLPPGSTIGDLPFIGTATNSMNNPGWALGPTYQTGGWQFCVNDDSFNLDVNGPANSINDGNWHHFLVVVDRSALLAKAYLDGVLVASRDIAALGNINNNNAPIVIGQDPTGLYQEPGTTTLDDLGIWRRALTAADAANIAAAGINGRSFDTVAPPIITVTKTGSSVTFSWSQGTLLQADAPDAAPGNWTPVPGASAPSYTFTPPTTGSKYYKVQVQ